MSRLTSFVIRQLARAAAGRFETATREPGTAQQRKLLEILARNRDSEYGRQYGFSSIRNMDDFRKQVPVVSYEDIQGQVNRMTLGEKNVLTAEAPIMFAQTSGTTGQAKYIPVTPSCKGRDHSDQMRTWIYHASRTHRGVFSGQILMVVSPAVEGYTQSGLPYGSASGHIYENLPWAVRRVYAIPYEAFLIPDYEARYYVLMRVAISADVSFVGTANPSTILKMPSVPIMVRHFFPAKLE